MTPSLARRGRRFESVRGLCKNPANERFSFLGDLQIPQLDADGEHFMELRVEGI
jgi:hypothetical protein